MKKIHLLIIDPQNDFCALPTGYNSSKEKPSLSVPGAYYDMERLSIFIENNIRNISDIMITMDSHYGIDISLTSFWKNEDGSEIKPFKLIKSEDVENGVVIPKNYNLQQYSYKYLKHLEKHYSENLIAWPVHCQIGTWGHNIHYAINKAYTKWERSNLKNINIIMKGLNPLIEQYSAVSGIFMSTLSNKEIDNNQVLSFVKESDILIIAGEASSHCIKKTLEHFCKYLNPKEIKKIVILHDCMSSVSGFEKQTKDFLLEIEAQGATISKSIQLTEELANI
ncbi:MAG: nicotinamidase [Candidatus Kinetoplastibacterium crithidii]|nr:MAG: nicotinamidase [Candidatus Kinetoplastibacterium crithidii]